MSSEIQNNEKIISGDLGEIILDGKVQKIIQSKSDYRNGSLTLTISQVVDHYLNGVPKTEDADFEIIEPKQLPNPSQEEL